MNSLNDIPRIKRLADKFGTPLQNVEFIGEGIRFTYKLGNNSIDTVFYPETPSGIQKEIERLQNFIKVEI